MDAGAGYGRMLPPAPPWETEMTPRMICPALALGAPVAPPAAAFTAWNGNAVR